MAPAALEQVLTGVERRLATAPSDPVLLRRRGDLLRALGRLAAARDAYAMLPPGDPCSRARTILSEAPVDWTDREGPAPFVLIDDFLDSEQQRRLWETVSSPSASFFGGKVKGDVGESANPYLRRADVMRHAGPVRDWFMPMLQQVIASPSILARLGRAPFALGNFELQVTRHGDGAYLWMHRDIGPAHPHRYISYVYYFHRSPRRFDGGDLLLYDEGADGSRSDLLGFTRIAPAANRLLLFPSDRWHSVTLVNVGGGDPLDARWTVNGWFNLPAPS